MPRPKRTEVAQAIPTARVVEPTSTSNANPIHATISPSSSGRVINGSDDSDGLVKTNRTGLDRNGVQAQEATMSGALPSEDVIVGGARVRPPTGRKRAALSRVARAADHARAIEALRARREAAMAAEKAEKVQIPSSMPEENVASKGHPANPTKEPGKSIGVAVSRATEQWAPGTVLKTREPHRAESSTISASAFKKRPRQPSLLQLIRSQNQDNPPMDDGDDDLDDLEDFCPDDESTPFPKLLSQPNLQRSPLASSSSPQQSSGSRKRKLTPPEVQVPASQPTQVSSQPQKPNDDLYEVSSQNDEPNVAIFSTEPDLLEPTLPPPRSIRTHTPQIWDDTQPPPRSSSSPPQHQNPSTRNTRVEPEPKPHTNRKQPSPGPSPVSPKSSPPTPAPVSRTLKPLSTATLQTLLPRRRLRSRPKPVAGAFDIPSSDAPVSSDVEIESVTRDEDEDELSYHTTAKSKRKPQDRRTTTLSKTRKSQPAKPTTASSKTYTRKKPPTNHAHDHIENADDEGSETLMRATNATPAKEANAKQRLEAKKKLESVKMHFREVDEWELEVEEVTGEGSSQVDAR